VHETPAAKAELASPRKRVVIATARRDFGLNMGPPRIIRYDFQRFGRNTTRSVISELGLRFNPATP
jgi:hypothetical protein